MFKKIGFFCLFMKYSITLFLKVLSHLYILVFLYFSSFLLSFVIILTYLPFLHVFVTFLFQATYLFQLTNRNLRLWSGFLEFCSTNYDILYSESWTDWVSPDRSGNLWKLLMEICLLVFNCFYLLLWIDMIWRTYFYFVILR